MSFSRKLSKEELDSKFDEFLQISGSTGDEDTEKIKELLKAPAKKIATGKVTSLWWANDSDEDVLQKGDSKTFIKSKKSQESPIKVKISSKSNNKSNNKNIKTNTTLKMTHSENTPTKSHVLKDSLKPKSMQNPLKAKSNKAKNEVTISKDSLEDISEKSEEHHLSQGKVINPWNVSLNDSSINTAGTASNEAPDGNTSIGQPGCDTLDELADKNNFFKNLEKEADGTVDYGRLNRDLSQTGGTSLLSPAMMVEQCDVDASVLSTIANAAAVATSLQEGNELYQKPSMLSKVALLDSMDSTFNTTTSPKVQNSKENTQDNLYLSLPDTLKNAVLGHMGTNTSKEMEALQQALQEAKMSPTLYGFESLPPSGKINILSSTPLYKKHEVDRSVGEIIREIDAIDRKGLDMENFEGDDVPLRSDYKSPRSPRSYVRLKGRFTDDTKVYKHRKPSATVKERNKSDKKSEQKGPRPTTLPAQNEKITIRSARDRFSHVHSSGYGRSLSPPTGRKSRSLSAGKLSPKGQRSSQEHINEQTKNSDSPHKSLNQKLNKSEKDFGRLHSGNETNLLLEQSPVSNFIDQIKEKMSANPGSEREIALLTVIHELREQITIERIQKLKLQGELISQEEEFQKQFKFQKVAFENEIMTLKQENFVLTAKLKEINVDREIKFKKVDSTSGSSVEIIETHESRLEREIQEQETLLTGYQAENKRLYEEIKNIKKQAKATESSMFKENQRLTTELSNLKQELDLKNTELQNKGVITSMAVQQQIAAGNAEAMMSASRVAHLEGELAEAKRVQDNLNRELKIAQQNRYELERHLENLLREKESLSRQIAISLSPEQVKDLEAKHKEELDKLNKKIKWYTENQELLDKSNAILRKKEDEIYQLKIRLEDFKSEAGRKLEENKLRAKEKAADVKKIQDLERQVKEMVQVIRKRYPNSLPAMMMVAANVPDVSTDVGQTKGRSMQVLENMVRKLEKELEEKDELAQQDLRAMEQKYNKVKLHFEERIADLEHQLSYCQLSGEGATTHPHTHAIALERELDNVKDRCRKQVLELQSEVDRLTAELNKSRKNQENLMRNDSWQSEGECRQQLMSLQLELKSKNHDIQLLQHTVEKLRSRLAKRNNIPKTIDSSRDPAINTQVTGRDYKPGVFADSGVSSLIQENQLLKANVDELQLQLDQQRVDLRKCLAETESSARQNQERLENEINVLRSNHKQEIQHFLSEHALLSSTSKVAELQSKCDTQEVMIRHLQSQLKKVSMQCEQLPRIKARESQLLKKIEELQQKLREAKMVQVPEIRHFESLEEKLSDLIIRQKKREAELESVVKQNQTMGQFELEEEVEKWKKMVDVKNQQLQVFRTELDSILEVLKTLQRQGVTLPGGTFYG